jgi:hypothetical protein
VRRPPFARCTRARDRGRAGCVRAWDECGRAPARKARSLRHLSGSGASMAPMIWPRLFALAALFSAGMGFGLTVGLLLRSPALPQPGQCAPGSRGYECVIERPGVPGQGAQSWYYSRERYA